MTDESLDTDNPQEEERRYLALSSDGDQTDTEEYISREEAFEWADEQLAMIEHLEPGTDHYVQIISYRPEGHESYPEEIRNV